MDAPISFRPGIAPPWPFPITTGFENITAASGPYWAGDWQAPPPEVCDILTASEWRIQFQFDPSVTSEPYSDAVTLDTTIKPGQIKRRASNGDEWVVGGDGYQSVEAIFTRNFLTSDEYPGDTMGNEILKLNYSWRSQLLDENGNPVVGYFNLVDFICRLQYPVIGKDENDDWVWLFSGLASYEASTEVPSQEPGTQPPTIVTFAEGSVINFMGNQHVAPVTGFPVVSLSIESHFGDD
jgi:hypothetical protein